MHIASTLRRKRDEIAAAIAAYEVKIDAGRMDLAAVDRVIRLFDPAGRDETAIYFELGRLWKPGEILAVCREALEQEGLLDTRQLALLVARAKGLDDQDAVLFKSVGIRVSRTVSNAMKRGLVANGGKRNGIRLWKRREAVVAPARGLTAGAVARSAGAPATGRKIFI
jgi:hypothetical protein